MACEILDASGDEGGPARLVRGAQATSVVAVKVFVKEDKVLPVRIGAVQAAASVAGSSSRLVGQEQLGQAAR